MFHADNFPMEITKLWVYDPKTHSTIILTGSEFNRCTFQNGCFRITDRWDKSLHLSPAFVLWFCTADDQCSEEGGERAWYDAGLPENLWPFKPEPETSE
jgi:hypothetical protein